MYMVNCGTSLVSSVVLVPVINNYNNYTEFFNKFISPITQWQVFYFWCTSSAFWLILMLPCHSVILKEKLRHFFYVSILMYLSLMNVQSCDFFSTYRYLFLFPITLLITLNIFFLFSLHGIIVNQYWSALWWTHGQCTCLRIKWPGFNPWPGILHCVLQQDTVPLSTQVYKWVLVYLMLGVTLL